MSKGIKGKVKFVINALIILGLLCFGMHDIKVTVILGLVWLLTAKV